VLDQDKKAQLAEGFNAFLKARRLAQGPMNNLTPETDNLKREAPMDPKKTGESTRSMPRKINANM
jgi:hypothetical protein